MILPSYYSSLRSRNVTIGHILSFSPVAPVSLEDEEDSDQSDTLSGTESELGHAHSLPPGGKRGRLRVLSESEASSAVRGAEPEFRDGAGSEEAPFRGRSQSAPAALWAAKRYGRQLRRMSDEFDSWLDRGGQEVKRGRGGGAGRQMKTSSSWFSFLWSPQETEDELHGNGELPENDAAH
ncbi:bcl2-associated agonist of cell death-like [Anguilla rostrata]|uniref:bcl2-associated agonist of cell death-like n=1 Tax=Anguilla anguilla TaxID=7936 RepID=UPI0015ACBC3A|nr:bcl2-associated agonist of cell death-like [Anguilla anguilla]